jgi:uncharacterized protein YbjT (DUF2867 family)
MEGHDAVLLNLDQPSTFPKALQGVDRVFLLTGYTVAMLAQSKTFVDAAVKASVQHIVHLGTFGHWDCTDPHIAWHQLIESYIKTCGIAWTHLHPNMFMEQIPKLMKIHNDRFPIFWGTDRMGWVACQDIGAATARVLRDGPEKNSGRDYWLSIEVANGQQLATLFSEVLGRSITCEYKTPEEFVTTALGGTAESWYAGGALEFLRQFYSGHMSDFGVIRDDTPYLLDNPPLSLREWLEQNRSLLEG